MHPAWLGEDVGRRPSPPQSSRDRAAHGWVLMRGNLKELGWEKGPEGGEDSTVSTCRSLRPLAWGNDTRGSHQGPRVSRHEGDTGWFSLCFLGLSSAMSSEQLLGVATGREGQESLRGQVRKCSKPSA